MTTISPSIPSKVPTPKSPCARSEETGIDDSGEANPDMRADITENWYISLFAIMPISGRDFDKTCDEKSVELKVKLLRRTMNNK
jgi:hypothetical protein